MHELKSAGSPVASVVTGTRGNHGRSVAVAASRHGLPPTVVVPHGNSSEKNVAMRAFGVRVLVVGAIGHVDWPVLSRAFAKDD